MPGSALAEVCSGKPVHERHIYIHTYLHADIRTYSFVHILYIVVPSYVNTYTKTEDRHEVFGDSGCPGRGGVRCVYTLMAWGDPYVLTAIRATLISPAGLESFLCSRGMVSACRTHMKVEGRPLR